MKKLAQNLSFIKSFTNLPKYLLASFGILIVLLVITLSYSLFLNSKINNFKNQSASLSQKLSETSKKLTNLENEDQVVKNKKLEEEIKNIHTNYKNLISLYNDIIDLKDQKATTNDLDKEFAQTLDFLADKNYSSASAKLITIQNLINSKTKEIAKDNTPQVTSSVVSNTPPNSGFSRQTVSVDGENFTVDLIAADLNSTKIIVDTASSSDCGDNCPVLPLATYVARSGGYAGINGSYFCPASYPNCAGKTNSFDLLIMNKDKYYFNSANNVYSTNPAVIFQNGSIRFVGQALQWGRDTGVDGVLSNYPLLVSGGNQTYSDGGDPKFLSKGPRNFVANKGSTAYIGIVYNATMGNSAKVLKALGMDNALNLDEGGSSALWYQGYKAGPGRDIPNAIIFVRK